MRRKCSKCDSYSQQKQGSRHMEGGNSIYLCFICSLAYEKLPPGMMKTYLEPESSWKKEVNKHLSPMLRGMISGKEDRKNGKSENKREKNVQ
jgi:hypothetical protein